MKFSDIETVNRSRYEVDVSWHMLKEHLDRYKNDMKVNMDPDFQRGYVWTLEQKTAFVEWGLRGGSQGMNIYWNCPNFVKGGGDEIVIVDGKQRITAVLEFLDNKVPVFGGHYFKDFTDKMDWVFIKFRFCIAEIKDRKTLLRWYIMMNTGGSVHTDSDISVVKNLIRIEEEKEQVKKTGELPEWQDHHFE